MATPPVGLAVSGSLIYDSAVAVSVYCALYIMLPNRYIVDGCYDRGRISRSNYEALTVPMLLNITSSG